MVRNCSFVLVNMLAGALLSARVKKKLDMRGYGFLFDLRCRVVIPLWI